MLFGGCRGDICVGTLTDGSTASSRSRSVSTARTPASKRRGGGCLAGATTVPYSSLLKQYFYLLRNGKALKIGPARRRAPSGSPGFVWNIRVRMSQSSSTWS